MKKIKIAITDPHELFRTGIALFLKNQPHFEVVATLSHGEELLSYLKQNPVDVLLLELNLPQYSSFSLMKKIFSQFPEVQVIILSLQQNLDHIGETLRLGAASFLHKHCEPAELLTAIRQVIITGYYINECASKALKRKYARRRIQNQLTPREQQVLRLLCQEMSSAEVAARLKLKTCTIDGYRKNLLAKTGAKNLAGLFRYALEEGVI